MPLAPADRGNGNRRAYLRNGPMPLAAVSMTVSLAQAVTDFMLA
jgi:hypothetical protein